MLESGGCTVFLLTDMTEILHHAGDTARWLFLQSARYVNDFTFLQFTYF